MVLNNKVVVYDLNLNRLGIAYASALFGKKNALYIDENEELIETKKEFVIILGFL